MPSWSPANFSGPVYFEKRSGEMQVAYPIFFDAKIDPGAETNRRNELARLMTTARQPAHRTRDGQPHMGPFHGLRIHDAGRRHGPAQASVAPGIAGSPVAGIREERLRRQEAHPLDLRFARPTTSRAREGKKNAVDDPARGHVPLFSRMYPKPLEAEQLYDSLLIATTAQKLGRDELGRSPETARRLAAAVHHRLRHR